MEQIELNILAGVSFLLPISSLDKQRRIEVNLGLDEKKKKKHNTSMEIGAPQLDQNKIIRSQDVKPMVDKLAKDLIVDQQVQVAKMDGQTLFMRVNSDQTTTFIVEMDYSKDPNEIQSRINRIVDSKNSPRKEFDGTDTEKHDGTDEVSLFNSVDRAMQDKNNWGKTVLIGGAVEDGFDKSKGKKIVFKNSPVIDLANTIVTGESTRESDSISPIYYEYHAGPDAESIITFEITAPANTPNALDTRLGTLTNITNALNLSSKSTAN